MRREFGLTAVMKLTARLPGQVQRLQTLLTKMVRSPALEVQTRSAEYSRMFDLEAGLRSQVSMEHAAVWGSNMQKSPLTVRHTSQPSAIMHTWYVYICLPS